MISSLPIQSHPSSCFCHTVIVSNPSFKASNFAVVQKNAQVVSSRSRFSIDCHQESKRSPDDFPFCCGRSFCLCGRRRFVETMGTAFFPIHLSKASAESLPDDPTDMLNKIRPPRPDWYEEFFAFVLDKGMKSYEAEIAGLKSQLFQNLEGKAERILELGIGTGPNLKYYAGVGNVQVFGTDPIRKMEKYSRAAAEAAGLPPTNFNFIRAVAEALPLSDDSVDAVIATLVLCSVKDVDSALQEVRRVLRPGGLFLFIEHVAAEDGTFLRFLQGVVDPLQQFLSDNCHLTRKTGTNISEAGFSSVDINMISVSTVELVKPHVYGVAYK